MWESETSETLGKNVPNKTKSSCKDSGTKQIRSSRTRKQANEAGSKLAGGRLEIQPWARFCESFTSGKDFEFDSMWGIHPNFASLSTGHIPWPNSIVHIALRCAHRSEKQPVECEWKWGALFPELANANHPHMHPWAISHFLLSGMEMVMATLKSECWRWQSLHHLERK